MKFYNFPQVRKEKSQYLPTFEMVPITSINEDGIVETKFEKRQIDVSKVNEGLKASDFSIRAIVESGAYDLLKENHSLASSPLSVATQVEQFADQSL